MGRRLILDTNVVIAYERGTIDRATLDDDELAVASVSVAEYRVGIELADTPERAAERSRALATIMSSSGLKSSERNLQMHCQEKAPRRSFSTRPGCRIHDRRRPTSMR